VRELRGSGSKLIEVPSSHFYDLLASFGDASGDGAADRLKGEQRAGRVGRTRTNSLRVAIPCDTRE
jgi:hypothetical protein